jgi:hypothetical protein
MVSTNRKFAYPCLYDIVYGRRYHVAYGPFFHYFANLWHPACRPYRGKADLVDDIAIVEAVASAMEQDDDPNVDAADEEMLLL